MEDLLKKIYDTVICYEQETVEMGWKVDREIEHLIEPYQEKISEKEQENLKNLLCCIALTAERESFLLGVKYTMKMLTKLMID